VLRRSRDFISAFFFKTAAGGRLLLPHKGGGNKRRSGGRIRILDHSQPLGELQRSFKTFRQPLADV
jgi:hypothetical protein